MIQVLMVMSSFGIEFVGIGNGRAPAAYVSQAQKRSFKNKSFMTYYVKRFIHIPYGPIAIGL